MNIIQFDVKTALLYSDIEEEIYMVQPMGFEHPDHQGHVCCICKALYGLQQSARNRNRKFTSFLRKYQGCHADG
jgi:hypothetical protein